MTNECDQETEQRSGYGDMQVEQHIERALCVRESLIFDTFIDFLASGEI